MASPLMSIGTPQLARRLARISRAALWMLVAAAMVLLTVPHVRAQAPTAARVSLVIDEVEIASFSELAEISSTTQHVNPLTGLRLVQPNVFSNIVLRRGLTSDTELWDWYESGTDRIGVPRGKNGAVVLHDRAGTPILRFHFENAWPSKIEVGELQAGPSVALIETVTLTCESIRRVAP